MDPRIAPTASANAPASAPAHRLDVPPATRAVAPVDGLARSGAYFDGVSAGHRVTWTARDLAATPKGASQPSFSLLRESRALYTAPPEEGDLSAGGETSVTARLRSVVGHLLAFEQTASGYMEGAAHPWAFSTLQTVDVRTGKPVSLRDLYPPQALYAALMKDPAVAKALGSARPKDLDGLLTQLDGQTGGDGAFLFSKDMLDTFAIHHLAGKQLAVRVALPHGTEAARGELAELGLLLPLPTGLEAAVKAAAAGQEGVLTPNLPRASRGRQTEMEFVTPPAQ